MRLFVAVELSTEMREVVLTTCDRLRLGFDRHVKARWTPAENLHVTVRFIGHVADADATPLIEAVRAPLDLRPFELSLGGCGVFPTGGPPRIIWIGFGAGSSSLASIHESLNRRLEPRGVVAENRPYSGHLTLARVKDIARGSAPEVRRTVQAIDVSPAICHVAHATVFRSLLSPSGARYEPLARIDLAT